MFLLPFKAIMKYFKQNKHIFNNTKGFITFLSHFSPILSSSHPKQLIIIRVIRGLFVVGKPSKKLSLYITDH